MLSRRALLAFCALVAVAGCRDEGPAGEENATLAVHFLVPPPPAPDPFDDLDSFRVSLVRVSDATVLATRDFDAGEPLSLELAPADGVRLVLEGLESGSTVARGRTAPFDLTSGGGEVWMYFSRVGTFEDVEGTHVPRAAPSVAALSDGRVLIAGGLAGNAPSPTTEIYDPATNALLAGPDLPQAHGLPVTIEVATDAVLLAGGIDAAGDAVPLAHVFDYDAATHTGAWVAAPMPLARKDHAGAPLGASRAILVGGTNATALLSSTSLFTWNGSAGSWTGGPAYDAPVKGLLGVAVEEGKALFGCGWTTDDGGKYESNAHVYTWSAGGGGFSEMADDFRRERAWAGFLRIDAGSWIVFGGIGDAGNPLSSTEILTWNGSSAGHSDRASLPGARRRGGGGRLPDGRILFVGGDTSTGDVPAALDSAAIWDPASDTMAPLTTSPGACVTSAVVPLADLTALVVCDDRVTRFNP